MPGDILATVLAILWALASALGYGASDYVAGLGTREASVIRVSTGSACYFVAAHLGLLAITAVITSLYPGSTILLARVLIGERLTRTRLAGLGLAAASVALIAVGGSG
jgi:hypothetical protein